MKQFALCIHDLRASDGEKIIETICFVREVFKAGQLTIHLVMDKDVNEDDKIFNKLKNEVEANQLEIVFHGVTHCCPPGTGKLFAWYHKYEAEFLSNTFNKETNRLRYSMLNEFFKIEAGICPPCWIANRDGWKFIKSLSPSYFEKLLSINSKGKHFFSLPVSLASVNKKELFFLKLIGTLISAMADIFNHSRLRLIIHTIDLTRNDSVNFLRDKNSSLISNGFSPVLQKDLIFLK